MKVSVHPGPVAQTSAARYLLVPAPPNTSTQSFVGLESTICVPPAWLVAENAPQGAWLFEAPESGKAELVFHFKDASAEQADNTRIFAKVESPLTAPSADLAAKVSEITSQCRNDAERLGVLIAFTASLFGYDHPDRPFNHGLDRMPLLLQFTKGNCSDIHGFLLSCLYAAGVECSYMAGFCFPGQDDIARGYHCWLASLCEGLLSHWDIAQHLKADISPVRPGLNPVGGRRIAMSIGCGLVFTIEGRRIQLPHFGYPMWIYADGVASGLGATARIVSAQDNPAKQRFIEEFAR